MFLALQALKKPNQKSEAAFFVQTRLPHVKLSMTCLPKSLQVALQKAMGGEAVDMDLAAAAAAPAAAAPVGGVVAKPAAAAAAAGPTKAGEGIDYLDL